jgi:hypothetical protein
MGPRKRRREKGYYEQVYDEGSGEYFETQSGEF